MFEPNTYWEKRVSALETLVLNLCKLSGLMGLVGAWHHQVELLKSGLVEERLGPVVVDENSATGQYVYDTIRRKMIEFGLLLDTQSYTEVNVFNLDLRKRAVRLLQLPDLEDAIGPDIGSGLFRLDVNVGEQDAEFAPVLVIRDGDLINFFVFSDDSMSPMTISLNHMPAGYQWNNPQHRHAWRSETFAYRDQLSQVGFNSAAVAAFGAVDWQAVYEKADAIELLDSPPPANDDVVAANDETPVEGDAPAPADSACADDCACAAAEAEAPTPVTPAASGDWFDSAKPPQDQ